MPIRSDQRPWDAEQDRQLRALIAERLTCAQIAERMGRSPYAVTSHVRKLHLRFLAKRRWTRKENRLLLKWREQGVLFREIAQVMGRTVYALRVHHERLLRAKEERGA